ncbi:ABC transporter ATP-binding protein [bacterium]|jgi:ABC-type multidrug transport system fused ATPase/permease subunit|nr:ABC transporter ATP-binding protein [bacterium]
MLGGAQFLCAAIMAGSVIIFPLVTRHITGEIIPNKQFDLFMPWVFLGLGSFFLKDALNCARIILNNHFEQRVIYDIRSDLYQKIQRLPLRWFDTRRTGDVMTRVVEDVTAMERILIDGIELGLISVIQILAVGITMYWMNASVAAWATLPVPFLMLGAWIYTRDARDRYKQQRESASDLNALLHDNIAGIRQIKAYAAEKEEHLHFNHLSNAMRRATLRVMKWWAFYSPGMSFLNMIGYVLVLGFGGYAVMTGEMKLPDLLAFFLLLSLFYEPVSKLHQLNQMALSSRAAADRVFEILDSEDEPEAASGAPLAQPVTGDVVFNDVSFAYDEDQPTLHNVSLQATRGQTIALAGSTGAGKSTIVNLLCRFYEYDSGSISIDGQELNTLAKNSLRASIGYVTQEAFLFNGTVRENLALADRNASDDDLWKALEAARAADFVRELPEQLETNVGERGVKLSGGEKQRLSIARALLKDPPILLLDEATASVDNQTELLIQQALDELMKNRTSIVVAHRLSTIQNADKIYVFGKGRLIEEGTYEELLENDGPFAELASSIK